MQSIGFMQGRLSPVIDGKIQTFPWKYWEKEFHCANDIGIDLMEWTLDQERIFDNPLMIGSQRKRIRVMSGEFNVAIKSVTGDCFMHSPFWKVQDVSQKTILKNIFKRVCEACAELKISYLVVPLVDDGALSCKEEEEELTEFLLGYSSELRSSKVSVLFESDYLPVELKRFIDQFPVDVFGINYDMGNSASLGWKSDEEFANYGNRIMNVHVKDRLYRGTTVPLSSGSVDFHSVFMNLSKVNYRGNYILQTARSPKGLHAEYIVECKGFVAGLINACRYCE